MTVERLAAQPGLSAFAADPHNGDVLMLNYLQNKIQRLVTADVSGSGFPAKLSDTGIFADLGTLAPNPGIVSYEPNVAFWSDYAIKRRWFTIPNLVDTVGFNVDGAWTLPTSMKWIKHFDLEMNRGNPATKRRIETRVLVKTDTGVYGVSYKWNDTQDEAFLVPDAGDFFSLTVTNGGVPTQQDWEIPSRSSCLACHTPVGRFRAHVQHARNEQNVSAEQREWKPDHQSEPGRLLQWAGAQSAHAAGLRHRHGHQFQSGVPRALLSSRSTVRNVISPEARDRVGRPRLNSRWRRRC